MRFWDSSALVALVVQQKATPALRELLASDPEIVAWTLSDVEIRSGLARLRREGALSAEQAHEAVLRAEELWATVYVISLEDSVKSRAKRLLGVHALRAADALQLGAALTAALEAPLGLEFACLDQRLGEAARREGLTVVP